MESIMNESKERTAAGGTKQTVQAMKVLNGLLFVRRSGIDEMKRNGIK